MMVIRTQNCFELVKLGAFCKNKTPIDMLKNCVEMTQIMKKEVENKPNRNWSQYFAFIVFVKQYGEKTFFNPFFSILKLFNDIGQPV